jgi:hypothetical protein
VHCFCKIIKQKNKHKIKDLVKVFFFLPVEKAGNGKDPLHSQVRGPAEGRLEAQVTTLHANINTIEKREKLLNRCHLQ